MVEPATLGMLLGFRFMFVNIVRAATSPYCTVYIVKKKKIRSRSNCIHSIFLQDVSTYQCFTLGGEVDGGHLTCLGRLRPGFPNHVEANSESSDNVSNI